MYDLLAYVVRPRCYNVQVKVQELHGPLCSSVSPF